MASFSNGHQARRAGSRYSSKSAEVLSRAALASPRAEPVVVCCFGFFGGLRFFAATSAAEGALLRAAVDPRRGEVTGAAAFARSLPDSTTTRGAMTR